MEEHSKIEEENKGEEVIAENPPPQIEESIFSKNLKANKNKTLMFEFVSTITKIDFCFEKMQGYLFWTSLGEIMLWFILIGLLISNISYMAKAFCFLYHIPRGTLGIVILFFIPKTYEVIDKIKDFEECSIEDISKRISFIYIEILNEKERIMKPLLIIYFVLSMVSIVVDIIMFCVITPDFGQKEVPPQLFFMLLLVDICFISADFVYILFFSGFKYIFPPPQNEAIHKAVIGFFTQLRVGIVMGFSNMAKKIGRIGSNTNANGNGGDVRNQVGENNKKGNVEEKEIVIQEDMSFQIKSEIDVSVGVGGNVDNINNTNNNNDNTNTNANLKIDTQAVVVEVDDGNDNLPELSNEIKKDP